MNSAGGAEAAGADIAVLSLNSPGIQAETEKCSGPASRSSDSNGHRFARILDPTS